VSPNSAPWMFSRASRDRRHAGGGDPADRPPLRLSMRRLCGLVAPHRVKLSTAMSHRGPLVRGRVLVWLAGLAACSAATAEAPGGFPTLTATAQARRYGAMMQAFESNMSGQAVLWSENDRVRGSVIPLETLHTSSYGWCREYEERIATSATSHHLVGIACRADNHQWLIVDIHSYVEAPRRREALSGVTVVTAVVIHRANEGLAHGA
jgi:surface antigen